MRERVLAYLCVCVCLWGGEVVLSDKGMRLEPPGFIWAKQEGPVSVWAVGPQSHEQKVPSHNSHLSSSRPGTILSTALCIHTGSYLSFCRCLCILGTSLLGRGLAYFYLCHSGPFDVDYVGLFHRSCVCLRMAPLLNPQSVYEYTFHKQDM